MNPCTVDSDCKEGMLCPKAGNIKGMCTLECAANGLCLAKGGEDAYCQTVLGLCGQFCGGSSTGPCPTGTHCGNQTGTLGYCVR